MNKIFSSLMVVGFLSSCLSTPIISPPAQPTYALQVAATEIPNAPKVGYLKTSLEVQRNGKSYQVVIGYDAGDGWRYDAPELQYPEWFQKATQAPGSEIHWAGDMDGDGEMEFVVEVLHCGASCANVIQVYDYDPLRDEYLLFDEFYGALGEDYKDVDGDGNPEIFSRNTNVFSYMSTSSAFAPILIYKYRDGKFSDVTKEYPQLIKEDAGHWLEATKIDAWEQGYGYVTLASYLYDMYLLDMEEEGAEVFYTMCPSVIHEVGQAIGQNCDEFLSFVQEEIRKSQNK